VEKRSEQEVHRYILVVRGTKRFWKYCSNCGRMIQDNGIDRFLKKMERHNCLKKVRR